VAGIRKAPHDLSTGNFYSQCINYGRWKGGGVRPIMKHWTIWGEGGAATLILCRVSSIVSGQRGKETAGGDGKRRENLGVTVA